MIASCGSHAHYARHKPRRKVVPPGAPQKTTVLDQSIIEYICQGVNPSVRESINLPTNRYGNSNERRAENVICIQALTHIGVQIAYPKKIQF